MSAMAREFFAASPVLVYPIAALVLFLAAFALATWRALRQPRGEIESAARMPLDDEEVSR